ncbi:MAG: membrane dipeptidase, partial [Chloroflexi bacterium]|nr:membrane dipeptidase [Chloroflexota bacterium]
MGRRTERSRGKEVRLEEISKGEKARRLLEDAIVIDGLDTSRWGSRTVYEGLRAGGVTAINATIAVWDDYGQVLENIKRWLRWFEEHRDLIRPVLTSEDVRQAKREGRTGVIFGWQNATAIAGDIDRLRLFHRLGVRVIQLTYNERNLLGNGCYERRDDGLSRFGLSVIREMNRLGILIDLSHCGDRTTLEAIEASESPVAITHANARSQFEHPRNKTDETIKRLAGKGGVIGANAFPMFFPDGFDSTLETYLEAIEYIVQLAGADHVGIGTDFCMEQPREWFEWIFSSQGSVPAASVAPTPQPYSHLKG